MLMLEPASILMLEVSRTLPPIVHKGNPGLYHNSGATRKATVARMGDQTDFLYQQQ